MNWNIWVWQCVAFCCLRRDWIGMLHGIKSFTRGIYGLKNICALRAKNDQWNFLS
jgi:hypothetical protein